MIELSINRMRLGFGITQKTAAADLGVAQSTWSNYERAEENPDQKTFARAVMIRTIERIAAAQKLAFELQTNLEDFTGKPKQGKGRSHGKK